MTLSRFCGVTGNRKPLYLEPVPDSWHERGRERREKEREIKRGRACIIEINRDRLKIWGQESSFPSRRDVNTRRIIGNIIDTLTR